MSLIRPEDYPAIRAAILTSLDASSLPDAIIEQPIYKGRAEAEVAALSSVTGVHQRNAAIYICASFLATKIPRIVSDTDDIGGSLTFDKVDWNAIAAELRALASVELALIIDIGEAGQPKHFVLGSVNRLGDETY